MGEANTTTMLLFGAAQMCMKIERGQIDDGRAALRWQSGCLESPSSTHQTCNTTYINDVVDI